MDTVYEEALVNGAWIEREPTARLIRLTGPQRVWFLQNTITADVEDVRSGRWVESCFLDPKGRIQAHFRVGMFDDEIWIDAEPESAALAEWFGAYKFRTKVDIEPVDRRCFTIVGPPATGYAGDGEVNTDGDRLVFGYTLGDVPAADVHTEGSPPGSLEAPLELYEVLRIEGGVGRFGVDFTDRDLPQEAGLTRVLSVEKGCYVGQETVARIHFRGHVNRTLRMLTFEGGDPRRGLELNIGGERVGSITSVASSFRKGSVGLAMVRVEPPEGGTVDVEGGGSAVLGPLPEGTKVKTA